MMETTGPFVPKSGHFFLFSKKGRGGPPLLPLVVGRLVSKSSKELILSLSTIRNDRSCKWLTPAIKYPN